MNLNDLYKEQNVIVEKERSSLNQQVEQIDQQIKELVNKKQIIIEQFNKRQIELLDHFNEKETMFHKSKEVELKELLSLENEIKMTQLNELTLKE